MLPVFFQQIFPQPLIVLFLSEESLVVVHQSVGAVHSKHPAGRVHCMQILFGVIRRRVK